LGVGGCRWKVLGWGRVRCVNKLEGCFGKFSVEVVWASPLSAYCFGCLRAISPDRLEVFGSGGRSRRAGRLRSGCSVVETDKTLPSALHSPAGGPAVSAIGWVFRPWPHFIRAAAPRRTRFTRRLREPCRPHTQGCLRPLWGVKNSFRLIKQR